ncbi:flagellar export protein FliJ [Ferrimonas marina]|uniref:Flagellar FliJ protein n=1 Tax=Ferrimonas marina TaxID=299255 RepID=A0A1M5YF53_9GAMM|nr:flagellar export protein FliJ [Ferrimonas marina]SHI10488.1 flagellar FliJ protein [Ferrimonas marina]
MSDPKQLAKVLELAEQAFEQASLNLRSANSAVAACRQQLQQLQNYRWDYVKQAQQQAGATLSASDYQQYHHFIAKLDAAIVQQNNKLEQSVQAQQQRQGLWQEAQQRQKAIALLLEKEQTRRAQALAQREQRAMDEFALQQYVRRGR